MRSGCRCGTGARCRYSFAKTERTIATGDVDGLIIFWDLYTGKLEKSCLLPPNPPDSAEKPVVHKVCRVHRRGAGTHALPRMRVVGGCASRSSAGRVADGKVAVRDVRGRVLQLLFLGNFKVLVAVLGDGCFRSIALFNSKQLHASGLRRALHATRPAHPIGRCCAGTAAGACLSAVQAQRRAASRRAASQADLRRIDVGLRG